MCGKVIVGDPMAATARYGVACVGASDSRIGENTVESGRRVAGLAKKLHV